MRLETVRLFLRIDAGAEMVAAMVGQWSGLRRHHLARNLEGSWGTGTHTLDLLWEPDSAPVDAPARLARVPGFERAEQLCYEPIAGGVREPKLRGGLWRTLLLRTRPGATPAHIGGLEHDLLSMPAYMRGIRNWCLSRVTAGGPWTHVWQQEYAALDDLLGEYLMHPFHWGWVDRWFDPEFPEWTVEGDIAHAFCPLETSILGWHA